MLQIAPFTLVLASKSPRRQQLVSELQIPFSVRTKEVEESYPQNIDPEQISLFLAQKKADAFVGEIAENEILLTSDTTVVCQGKVYEKAANREEAAQMLRELSGKWHKVITGVCLSSQNQRHCFQVVTQVLFRDLDEDEIYFYVDHYAPYDKAGSYGIQEWIGLVGIEKIEGCYYNVVGLPVSALCRELGLFAKKCAG